MWLWWLIDGGGEREPGAVVAVSVVAADRRERQEPGIAVHHDEDRVDRGGVLVIFVVTDVGAYDAGTPASLLVDLFKPVPAAFTAATPIVAVNVEFRAIVEGDGAVVDAGELNVKR